MAKHTLKILQCEHHKILKVYLAIIKHYAWKVYGIFKKLRKMTDLKLEKTI